MENGLKVSSMEQHLAIEDIRLLLAARGYATFGSPEALRKRLGKALKAEAHGTWAWRQLKPLPMARFNCSLVTDGDNLYAFGGFDEDARGCSSVLVWSSAEGTWREVQFERTPPALYNHAAAMYKGEMWVIGAEVRFGILGERNMCVLVFNPKDWTWRSIETDGDKPHHVIQKALRFDAVVCDDRLLAFMMDGIFELDLERRVWQPLYRPEEFTSWWCSYRACIQDGKILLFGWGDASLRPEDVAPGGPPSGQPRERNVPFPYQVVPSQSELTMWELDLQTMRWRPVEYCGVPPSTRDRCTAEVLDGRWVVHGGIHDSCAGQSLCDTFIFHFATRTWTSLETINPSYRPSKRGCHGSTVARFGADRTPSLVVIGGREDWHGRNKALSTPCFAVEVLSLLDAAAARASVLHDNAQRISDADGVAEALEAKQSEAGHVSFGEALAPDAVSGLAPASRSEALADDTTAGLAASRELEDSTSPRTAAEDVYGHIPDLSPMAGTVPGPFSEQAQPAEPQGEHRDDGGRSLQQKTRQLYGKLSNSMRAHLNMKELCLSTFLSDITLVAADGTRFPCHRVVLAAASPYFENSFRWIGLSGSGDSPRGGREEMLLDTEVETGAARMMLQYMYGVLDTFPASQVLQLLHCAELYQVRGLKTECTHYLVEMLDHTNCCGAWCLAQQYQNTLLRGHAAAVASATFAAMQRSEGLKELQQQNPQLAADFLMEVAAMREGPPAANTPPRV